MSETKPDRNPIVYDVAARSFSIGGETFSTAGLDNETIQQLAMRGLAGMIRQSKDRLATMASVREGAVFTRGGDAKPRRSTSKTLAATHLAVASRMWSEVPDKKPGTKKSDGVASMMPAAIAEVSAWDDDRKKKFAKTPAYFIAMAELAANETE